MNWFDILTTVVGSGAIGSFITYLVTFKSKQIQAKAEADVVKTEAELKHLDLLLDLFTYLTEMCDKYMKEYYAMHDKWRDETEALKTLLDTQYREAAIRITDKCNEIATLKSKITYLQGLRCYKMDCPHRIKENPDK